MPIPLHNHTEYSALDGLARVSEIADRCEELGCPCCGITDHGVVSGHLEFDKVLRDRDIKPVFGAELYHGVKTEDFERNERDQAHLVALAMTDQGLRNLWALVDTAYKDYFRYVGRVNWDMLRQYSQGLVITSACIQGLVPRAIEREGNPTSPLNKYLDIFGDNFYIELHTYPGMEQINLALADLAMERGIGVVYADDAHRAFEDQYDAFDMYVAKSTGDSIYTPVEDRKMWHPKDSLYIRDEDGVRKALNYLPDSVVDEAISNSERIAEQADAHLPGVERHLPIFIPAECPWIERLESKAVRRTNMGGYSAAELFIDLVEEGLERRYGVGYPDEIFDRAEKEMGVFLDAGLEHYFLLEWDKNQYCDAEGILRGPGRGSAAGCIVAYALGITDIDPLVYNLSFERFYNPGRAKGFPDIDSDYPREDRSRVKAYLEERWGERRVRTIGTITRLKPKEALNATYQACGISEADKEAIKKIVGEVPDIDILGSDSIGWDKESDPGKTIYVEDHVGEGIVKYVLEQPEKQQKALIRWLNLVAAVCSRVDGYGVHPSGIIVSDVDLPDETPCFWSAGRKTLATMFPMNDVDARQFVKLDVLGLRTLDTLKDWHDQVSALGLDVEWSGLETRYNEEEMWQLLDKGLSQGIFQVEDGYARRLAKDFRPRSVEDLAIIVALNRPGPIRSGAPDSFIARRNGDEEVTYDHPFLEDILDKTYGWFLYQEQVIRYFAKLGLNESDADAVRKILGKKKPEEMRELRDGTGQWKGKGYFELTDRNGIDGNSAKIIWNKLEDFAKYSFNKSHAVAYAVLGFRTLYAKYVAPHEFYIACIRTNAEKAGDYVAEARRMGIGVHPPDIDVSEAGPAVVNDDIYLGFSDVKGVRAAGKYIVELREDYDLSSPEKLDEALEAEFLKWKETKEKVQLEGRAYKKKSPRQTLGRDQIEKLYTVGVWDQHEDRDLALSKVQEIEKELLGVILTDNTAEVMDANRDDIDECDEYRELDNGHDEDELYLRLPGVVSFVRETKTKKAGKKMGIITIEYEGDDAEFVVFPQQWKAYKFLWKERTPGIFVLKKTDRGLNFEEGIKLS